MRTSLGPPGTTCDCAGAAGSSTHSPPRPSATTLCTHTQWSSGETSFLFALRQRFQSSSGYGRGWPPTSSATETGASSDQRGKQTKMRPVSETVTPVTWCLKVATRSSEWLLMADGVRAAVRARGGHGRSWRRMLASGVPGGLYRR